MFIHVFIIKTLLFDTLFNIVYMAILASQ